MMITIEDAPHQGAHNVEVDHQGNRWSGVFYTFEAAIVGAREVALQMLATVPALPSNKLVDVANMPGPVVLAEHVGDGLEPAIAHESKLDDLPVVNRRPSRIAQPAPAAPKRRGRPPKVRR